MLGKTHIVFALFIGLLCLHFGISGNPILLLLFLVLGALLPDIDESHSYIGRRAKIIGWLFPHRGIFHSILMAVFLTIILYGVFPRLNVAWFFLIGYLSHIIGEGITPKGVRPFYPSKMKLKGPLRVGRTAEKIVFWILLVVDVYLVLLL